jgi:DNA-binding response OmpR family regulator
VVEDERKVASFVQKGFEEEGYAVDVAPDGEKAIFLAETNDYDVIILDWMIPKRDGLAVLRHLRASGVATPVILLTAKDAVNDKVQGLNSGADDYLTKPFEFAELLARVRRSSAAARVINPRCSSLGTCGWICWRARS